MEGWESGSSTEKKKNPSFIHINNKQITMLTRQPLGVVAISRSCQDTDKVNYFRSFDLVFTENLLLGP